MKTSQKNGTVYVRILCAILFCSFSILYLYFYQADILAVSQHLLSQGQTHYEKGIGTLLITLTLFLLHMGMLALTRLTRSWHALTYFPSFLLLGMLTGISPHVTDTFHLQVNPLVFLGLLLAYLVAVVFARKGEAFPQHPSAIAYRNLFCMGAMMLMTGLLGNGDKRFHAYMKAENNLLHGDAPTALAALDGLSLSDSTLTMLRAFALSQMGQLGDRLFEWQPVGGSDALLPDGKAVRLLLFPESRFYQSMGVWVSPRPEARRYFERAATSPHRSRAVGDYQLCAYLLDRDLDAFARMLPAYYSPADSLLPRYYREALDLMQSPQQVGKQPARPLQDSDATTYSHYFHHLVP